MWFDDHIQGRRLFTDRRGNLRETGLNVNVRLRAHRSGKTNQPAMIVLFLLLAAAVIVLVWFTVKKTGDILYSENPRFKVANLDIKTGKVITPNLVKEYTHIYEGMNLFGFNTRKVRNDFLRRTPNIKSMSITRYLPDTVKIEVVERDPMARLGSKTGLLVADREGYVFIVKSGHPELPVIVGYKDQNLKPGNVVQGMTLAALEALDVCMDPRIGLKVDSIDVSQEDFAVLYVPYADAVREIKLAWKGMGTGTAASRQNLLKKLGWTLKVLQSEEGKRFLKLDITFEGGRVHTQ